MFGCPDKAIHPLLRRADCYSIRNAFRVLDSSPLTKGRPMTWDDTKGQRRFIPSYEGQTLFEEIRESSTSIHPLLRRADTQCLCGFQPFQTPRCAFCTNAIFASPHAIVSIFNMPKKYFFYHFFKYFSKFFNPHSVFIVYNNFFAFAYAVYFYIFKDACFRLTIALKFFNF